MTNHLHLVVQTPGESLPDFAQLLLATHAIRYNRHTDRTGPLFDGRYHSVPIDGDRHFVATCRYVHRNPVVITGLDALPAYRWSSLGVLLGRRAAPCWLDLQRLAEIVDPIDHLASVRSSAVDDLGFRGLEPILRPRLDEIVLAAETAVEAQAVVVPGGRFDPGRSVAMMLAVELRAATTSEIATVFGVSPHAVRLAARRGRARAATDSRFARLHADVLEDLVRTTPIRRHG
ncbi:MAG: hypothetical protein AAGF91_11450 [Actinomycetota bacterium]